jgi:DNA-binding LacI/PurR family transcriptional regulator
MLLRRRQLGLGGNILTGIRDLARHLDISIGTVSRALNDRADVNAETRNRVREAAAQLGYSPNQSGRSLRRGRTDLVGVIIPTGGNRTLITPVFLSVLDGLRRRLFEQRLDLSVFLHGPDEPLFGSLRRLTERGLVDGLIIANTQRIDPRIEYLVESRRPFVAFGRSLSGGGHPWVDPDFTQAVESSVAMLWGLGHRSIALMLPVGETNYLHLILEAYRCAMKNRGLAIERAFVQRQSADESGGVAAGAAFLGAGTRPTAILVSEEIQAFGLYRHLNEAGMRPGRDISLIGLLPEERVNILSPALTTFQTNWTAIGARLGEALIEAMARHPLTPPERQSKANAALRPLRAIQTVMPVALRAGESIHRLAEP